MKTNSHSILKIKNIDLESALNISSSPRPTDRFNPNDLSVYEPTTFEPITYRCLFCKNEISFRNQDFQKHSKSNFSNLNIDDSKLLDKFIAKNNIKTESFIDFYCPKCKKATRLYYIDSYGGKHGQYLVKVQEILAIDK